jgi:GNAT superfamily N-acetyltransferase
MSTEEFHVMEHRLGWKHEYWDGAAQLSCQPTAVASLRLELPKKTPGARELGAGYALRTATSEDASELVELFVRTFDTAIEYAGWSQAEYGRSALRSVESFFVQEAASNRHHSQGLLEHSFVAHFANVLVAAILVRRIEPGPLVEPIMVEPAHQRHGLGSALLAAAVCSLQNSPANALLSRCHLGNTISMNWHLRNGFVELPNYFTAGHRSMHFGWLAEHYRSRRQNAQAAEMERFANHWASVAERLELTSDPWAVKEARV